MYSVCTTIHEAVSLLRNAFNASGMSLDELSEYSGVQERRLNALFEEKNTLSLEEERAVCNVLGLNHMMLFGKLPLGAAQVLICVRNNLPLERTL